MGAYIFRRLLLIPPTLFGILLINFLIAQAAPGGPVEQMIANLQGHSVTENNRAGGSSSGVEFSGSGEDQYRGAQGLPPEILEEIKVLYGFDKPLHERFIEMIVNYLSFDFGDSFFRNISVVDLIWEKCQSPSD